MVVELACQVCVVGNGYAGLNALNSASKYLSRGDRIVVVARAAEWGGHWSTQVTAAAPTIELDFQGRFSAAICWWSRSITSAHYTRRSRPTASGRRSGTWRRSRTPAHISFLHFQLKKSGKQVGIYVTIRSNYGVFHSSISSTFRGAKAQADEDVSVDARDAEPWRQGYLVTELQRMTERRRQGYH